MERLCTDWIHCIAALSANSPPTLPSILTIITWSLDVVLCPRVSCFRGTPATCLLLQLQTGSLPGLLHQATETFTLLQPVTSLAWARKGKVFERHLKLRLDSGSAQKKWVPKQDLTCSLSTIYCHVVSKRSLADCRVANTTLALSSPKACTF